MLKKPKKNRVTYVTIAFFSRQQFSQNAINNQERLSDMASYVLSWTDIRG